MQLEPSTRARQSAGDQSAAPSGLEEVVAELSRIRDALRMFPPSWEGAAAVHRQASRVDLLLERMQRASCLPPEFVQQTTARFSMLLQNGARPHMAMQMSLREAIGRQFAIAAPAAAEDVAA